MTVEHSTLTGASLHEPKGVENANSGEVYIADGSGSGAWGSVGTSSLTGMVAAFITPSVPTGWLELDGTDISTTTYASLYNVMTIEQSGTRTNGSAIITGLASTSKLKAGYYVFGTGFAAGTVINSVDSGTQITVSNNASSSGTSTVASSPWRLGSGIIRLPQTNSNGEFLRSRASGQEIGTSQLDAIKAHTHSFAATTGIESANHQHAISITDPGHKHAVDENADFIGSSQQSFAPAAGTTALTGALDARTRNTGSATTGISASAGSQSVNHTHDLSGTTGSFGVAETRPRALVVMFCVKT